MNRKVMLLLTVVVLVVVMCGCSTFDGYLSIASSEYIDINNKEFELVEEEVTGEDSATTILVFIPVDGRDPSIGGAINAALNKVGGDLMRNVHIYDKFFWIPFLVSIEAFVVEGDVYRVVK